jgi:hypothetical protein
LQSVLWVLLGIFGIGVVLSLVFDLTAYALGASRDGEQIAGAIGELTGIGLGIYFAITKPKAPDNKTWLYYALCPFCSSQLLMDKQERLAELRRESRKVLLPQHRISGIPCAGEGKGADINRRSVPAQAAPAASPAPVTPPPPQAPPAEPTAKVVASKASSATGKRFCTTCGAVFAASDQFCGECGAARS